jgi:hypothetical protein
MSDSTRSMFRTFGNLGAILVVMAAFVAWYDFDVAFAVPGVAFSVPISLWSLYPGAAALLTVAALAGFILANVPGFAVRRATAVVAFLLGLAITVYSAVRVLDAPHIAVFQLPRPAGTGALEASTHLDGGPFLSLMGGFLVTLGSLPLLVPARERARRGAPSRAARMPAA